jgi:hypothetical protein
VSNYWSTYHRYGTVRSDPAGSGYVVARIFDWMPPFIMVTGIVGLVSDAVPDAVGIALIVVGAVGSAVVRKVSPARPKLLSGSKIPRGGTLEKGAVRGEP